MPDLLAMNDGITPSAMPHGARLYASYVDGNWPNFRQLAHLFPGTGHVSICVDPAHDAEVLDCETGDARPDQCPAWSARQRAAGRSGTVYCNTSTWPQVLSAFINAKVTPPPWWAAKYDGKPALVADVHCIGHQYASHPTYDASVVTASWAARFLLKPPASKPPVPTPVKDDDMSDPMVRFTVDTKMAGAPTGTPWPGEFLLLPYAGAYVHIDGSTPGADNVAAFTAGGAVNGGVISYQQHVDLLARFGGAVAPVAA